MQESFFLSRPPSSAGRRHAWGPTGKKPQQIPSRGVISLVVSRLACSTETQLLHPSFQPWFSLSPPLCKGVKHRTNCLYQRRPKEDPMTDSRGQFSGPALLPGGRQGNLRLPAFPRVLPRQVSKSLGACCPGFLPCSFSYLCGDHFSVRQR